MYMLVSHRNMISVFDMTKGQGRDAKWIDTIKFDAGFVRQIHVKKISKAERSNKKDSISIF